MLASFRAFLSGLFIVIILATVMTIGSFNELNRSLLPFITSFKPAEKSNDHTSVLIYHDKQTQEALVKSLNMIIPQIKAFNAKAIIYRSYHQETGASLKSSFPELLVVPVRYEISETKRKSLDWPEILRTNGVFIGFKFNSFELLNASQSSNSEIGNKRVEAANEELSKGLKYFNPVLNYRNFPVVTLQQLEQGGLIPELFTNKIVVIDELARSFQSQSSIAYKAEKVTTIEATLFAHQQISDKTYITHASILFSIFLLIATYFLTFILFQLASIKYWLYFNGLLVVSTLLLSFVALVYFYRVIPIVELITLQLVTGVYLIYLEKYNESKFIAQKSSTINARLAKKFLPLDFSSTDKPWENLHVLVNQHIPLGRSIFLETMPGETRMSAIDAFNCSIDDISERRRDFQRTPYSTAIELNAPFHMEKYHYFKDAESNESEYLAPLLFSGELMGFWAITLKGIDEKAEKVIERHIAFYAREIASLLHQRRLALLIKEEKKNKLRQLFQFQVSQREYQSLNASISLLEKRYEMFEDVFDGQSNASILYDLFGQVIYANARVELVMKKASIDLYQMTAHDLLVELTYSSSGAIKDRLAVVTLQGTQFDFPIKTDSLNKHYQLRVRSLKSRDSSTSDASNILISGLLIEFIDIGTVQSLVQRKASLYEQHFHQMRNNLTMLNLLVRQIKKKDGDARKGLMLELENVLEKTTDLGEQVEHQLKNTKLGATSAEPINVLEQIEAVRYSLADILTTKGIQFKITSPQLMSLCLVPLNFFNDILSSSFELLVEDSASNLEPIRINIIDSNLIDSSRRVRITLKNTGYGVPNEQLSKMLNQVVFEDNESVNISERKLIKLITLRNESVNFDIELVINSSLGKGYTIEITLPVFEMTYEL